MSGQLTNRVKIYLLLEAHPEARSPTPMPTKTRLVKRRNLSNLADKFYRNPSGNPLYLPESERRREERDPLLHHDFPPSFQRLDVSSRC